jgi:hypothetical protein
MTRSRPDPERQGIPFAGLGVGGREPDVRDVAAEIDTSPRGQLLRFLDHRVFNPILYTTALTDASPTEQEQFEADRQEAARLQVRLHGPQCTAADIKAAFLSLSEARAGDPAIAAPSLGYAGRDDVRGEFLQLCQGLGV